MITKYTALKTKKDREKVKKKISKNNLYKFVINSYVVDPEPSQSVILVEEARMIVYLGPEKMKASDAKSNISQEN